MNALLWAAGALLLIALLAALLSANWCGAECTRGTILVSNGWQDNWFRLQGVTRA